MKRLGSMRHLMCSFGLLAIPSITFAQDPVNKPVVYAPGVEIARLANQKITESSGIAAGRVRADVFFTHNDSGDKPRFFAFNEKGDDLGTFNVIGAEAKDWEDMASFSLDNKNYLLFADVGDNAAKRKSLKLYIVLEPMINAGANKLIAVDVTVETCIEFSYEDGSHNCETVMVDPANKKILLVSKSMSQECAVYELPLTVSGDPVQVVAKRIAVLNISVTTGGDLSPNNHCAIISTYVDAYEYVRLPTQNWAEAFALAPRVVKLPKRKQGEAICYGLDGKALYLTSEQLPSPLFKIQPVD